jgi:hypothetical protein
MYFRTTVSCWKYISCRGRTVTVTAISEIQQRTEPNRRHGIAYTAMNKESSISTFLSLQIQNHYKGSTDSYTSDMRIPTALSALAVVVAVVVAVPSPTKNDPTIVRREPQDATATVRGSPCQEWGTACNYPADVEAQYTCCENGFYTCLRVHNGRMARMAEWDFNCD